MELTRSVDVTRVTLQVLAIGALIVASFSIVRPFLVSLTWATTIVVATWPLLLRAQTMLGGRRALAVAVMTLALALTLVLPLFFVGTTLVRNADRIEGWARALTTAGVPAPPAWIETIPMAGTRVAARWRQVAATGTSEWSEQVLPALRAVALWFVGQMGSVASVLVQSLLAVVIAAILYANGERAADSADRFARRLAGERGTTAVVLAAHAIRAVAMGVVVTALLQSVLGGIGLVVAGVPFAALLTAVMFILAIAQIGAAPVLLGATIWVYMTNGAAWGTAFLVWAVFCGTLDNFVRPILIRRGADIPLLLIFTGVIGGLIAFGIIGLFIGPVVLAVGYTLLAEWVADDSERVTAGSR
jgi:predicted PurR-regulated permease PerM